MDWYGLENFASGIYKNIDMEEIGFLKEELKQTQLAYQMAAQAIEFKSGFLARTAHELRSPLTSLIGLHQLILNDLCENPEEERDFISQAYESAKKLMAIIDRIVAVSQVEYGSMALDLVAIDLLSLLEEVDSLTNLQAANNRLPVKILLPKKQVNVLADRSRLLQVIVTLIDTGISIMRKNSIQGNTRVEAIADPDSNLVKIQIDLNCCPGHLWSEPVNLLQQIPDANKEALKNFAKELEMSPGMKLMVCNSMLETMKGTLVLEDLTRETNQTPFTRLQCWIPLAR